MKNWTKYDPTCRWTKSMRDQPAHLPLPTLLRELREVNAERYASDLRYRVLRLNLLERRSHRRISEEENLPLHTVKRWLRKARLFGVHAVLSGRGNQENGRRNRNFGLTRSQEVLLRDRIQKGWGSAKETQQWLQELRQGATPPITIAAIYGYRRRLARGIRERKKASATQPREPGDCLDLLKARVFGRSKMDNGSENYTSAELREMVRTKLGPGKMAACFADMGATEVSMPEEVAELLDDRGVWPKVVGFSRESPFASSGPDSFAIVLERNRRAPRGGSYVRSGFLVTGVPGMKNLTSIQLRARLQKRFSEIYDRYVTWNSSLQEGQSNRRKIGLEKLRDKLSDFLVLQTGPIRPEWWLVGTSKWSPTKATAFEYALKVLSVGTEPCRRLGEKLLRP
jgi:transposase